MNDMSANTGTGYLIIRVSTALGAIPVQGAKVTVRDGVGETDGTGGGVISVLTTDRDGKTERLPLAAPPRSISLTPGEALTFANYNIDVEAPGFYRLFFHQVPIYDGVTSIQGAALIPIAENGNSDGVSDDETHFEGSVNPYLRTADPPMNERSDSLE